MSKGPCRQVVTRKSPQWGPLLSTDSVPGSALDDSRESPLRGNSETQGGKPSFVCELAQAWSLQILPLCAVQSLSGLTLREPQFFSFGK